MQLLALTTLAAMAMTAQAVGHIRATFYNQDGGCHGPWQEDFAFVENPPFDTCIDLPIPLAPTFTSTYFNESDITKTFQFFNKPCSVPENQRNYFLIKPSDGKTPGCKSGPILSYEIRDKTQPLL